MLSICWKNENYKENDLKSWVAIWVMCSALIRVYELYVESIDASLDGSLIFSGM